MSQISQENTFGNSLLWIYEIFENTYFEEYLPTTASVVSFSW